MPQGDVSVLEGATEQAQQALPTLATRLCVHIHQRRQSGPPQHLHLPAAGRLDHTGWGHTHFGQLLNGGKRNSKANYICDFFVFGGVLFNGG